MKTDALYIRTSPVCPDDQRERLEKKLGKSKRPRQWYEDVGCDLIDDRPALQNLIDDIKAGRIGRVYFCNLQVIGFRSLDELAEFMNLCHDHGVDIRAPEPTWNAASRAAKAFRSERRSIPTRDGLAKRQAEGKPQGGDRRSGTREIKPAAVRKILDLHDQGVSDSEIARRVGHDRRTVKSVWERGG